MLGYSDADWVNESDDRHSTTGNVFTVSGGAVSWLSQKQATVALSIAEAEYITLGSAAQEAIWLYSQTSLIQAEWDPRVSIKQKYP